MHSHQPLVILTDIIRRHFIDNIQTINTVQTYLLGSNLTTTIPQTPEYEKLGLVIEHSKNGDFFGNNSENRTLSKHCRTDLFDAYSSFYKFFKEEGCKNICYRHKYTILYRSLIFLY